MNVPTDKNWTREVEGPWPQKLWRDGSRGDRGPPSFSRQKSI